MFTIWPYWLYPRFWTSGTGAMNFTTLIEERNRHTLSHTKLWYGVDEVQKRVLNFWIISIKQNCVWTNLRLGENNCNCRSAKIIHRTRISFYTVYWSKKRELCIKLWGFEKKIQITWIDFLTWSRIRIKN